MGFFHALHVTALVAFYSLLPPRSAEKISSPLPLPAAAPLEVPPHLIPFRLADFSRSVGSDGILSLFFPGCRAPAAPFLLFRLKRSGFSGCRAVTTPAGLTLTAFR
ncbi:MAG TPA: hypothetical protein VI389_08030 [Geobacteraceae bacterium]